MTYEMRRKDRKVTDDRAREILDSCEYGVLSMVCPDGTPYAVPLNFAREGDSLYMHCAREGRKLDILANDSRCAFTAVTGVELHQDSFATDYSSVMCFGTVEVIDGAEKLHALEVIVRAKHSDFVDAGLAYIEKAADAVYALRFDIEELSGKVCTVK